MEKKKIKAGHMIMNNIHVMHAIKHLEKSYIEDCTVSQKMVYCNEIVSKEASLLECNTQFFSQC